MRHVELSIDGSGLESEPNWFDKSANAAVGLGQNPTLMNPIIWDLVKSGSGWLYSRTRIRCHFGIPHTWLATLSFESSYRTAHSII